MYWIDSTPVKTPSEGLEACDAILAQYPDAVIVSRQRDQAIASLPVKDFRDLAERDRILGNSYLSYATETDFQQSLEDEFGGFKLFDESHEQ